MTILALAAAIVGEPPMIPAFFTGEKLYAFCRQEDDAQCIMYVAGALDGIFYARHGDPAVRLCPSRMSNREAATLTVGYLEKNPEARKLAAAAAIREAVASKIECDSSDIALDK